MQPIGGYFSLELPFHKEYHQNALHLNTGRNCLEYILRTKKYKKIYLPYFTCEVVLEPIFKLNIEYEFYHVDLYLEICDHISLKSNEALLYVNYFGLKHNYVDKLAKKMGKQLIVDNTQAFFAKPVGEIDTFYSCRKFFGVPDGAYIYTNKLLGIELEQDHSFNRLTSLTKRIDIGAEAGFDDFRKASKALANQPIKKMSNFTRRMMQSIDYQTVSQIRRDNYRYLHNYLASKNLLELPMDKDAVPMVYPYLTDREGLRDHLIKEKIYVARYWPNVLEWTTADSLEWYLTRQMIPLPIDQRYGKNEMNRIINCIL